MFDNSLTFNTLPRIILVSRYNAESANEISMHSNALFATVS